MTILNFIIGQEPPPKPFHRVGPWDAPAADMVLLLKIVKLDPRDRAVAEELLGDI